MKTKLIIIVAFFVVRIDTHDLTPHCIAQSANKNKPKGWTQGFNLDECTFSSTGRNTYFILEPGYQMTLEDTGAKNAVKLIITVLNETTTIGDIEARVVEEKEIVNGSVIISSRNYYAFCTQTNSVFQFGQRAENYKDWKAHRHSGSWRADSGDAKPGLAMPGIILLGARYYREIAPGVAMDKVEILGNTEALMTPAGKFEGCLRTEESSPLRPERRASKYYAPGVGLVKDGDLSLTRYGFIN